jgi:hypothetical protein
VGEVAPQPSIRRSGPRFELPQELLRLTVEQIQKLDFE